MAISDKRICIVGGAGFIGSHMVDRLVEWGNEVMVIDNLSASTMEYLAPHVEAGEIIFYQGDIRDGEFLQATLKDIDIVLHFAADPDVKNSVPFPVESFEINVRGTLNLLEAVRKNDIPQMAFASSGGTLYGQVNEFPITEQVPIQPISPYGASKAAGEVYIAAYANSYDFKTVSWRYANIFGPRSNHGVTYDFFNKLRANSAELEILGDGTQQKDYLYISDCVDASLLCAEQLGTQQTSYDAYNIGGEGWYSVNALADVVVDAMGLSGVTYTYTGGTQGWIGDVSKMLLDISKIKELGWVPQVSFEEGIKHYIQWLIDHEAGH